jgi:hypothetical protein
MKKPRSRGALFTQKIQTPTTHSLQKSPNISSTFYKILYGFFLIFRILNHSLLHGKTLPVFIYHFE